jgi:hypothetical protein
MYGINLKHMAKSHLPKSIRKHIAKEKARFRRDNLTREDYERKVGELYEALEKKPKKEKPKEKKEKKPIGKIVEKSELKAAIKKSAPKKAKK